MVEKITRKPLTKIDYTQRLERPFIMRNNETGLVEDYTNRLSEITEDCMPLNMFFWFKPEDRDKPESDCYLVYEDQLVLVSYIEGLTTKYRYGMVNLNGFVDGILFINDCETIEEVSKEEYLYNTSRWFASEHPEYDYLKNPNTNDYCI